MLGVVWTLLLLVAPSLCFNHWMVTEDGKIEYQLTSPFNLRQPFNLLAFMQQEERVSVLRELKDELLEYRNEFEGYSTYENFDASFRMQDPECKNVKLLSAFDLYISTVLPLEHKEIRFLDHLDLSNGGYPGEPLCATFPLDFSPYALEHLPGVQLRRSLVAPPEKSVLASVDMRLEVFGSLVHHALEKNTTSWVLLNLATLYWRARGNPYHGVECIRRALHYSPQHSMDIPLLNLANILHRSQRSLDAIVPLEIAISLSPNVNVLHYTMGNVYAALGQVNNSAASFRRSLDLEPTSETIRSIYMAALCELRLEEVLKERSQKLELTKKKLDQFYNNLDLVRQNQLLVDGSSSSRPTEDEFQISGVKQSQPRGGKKGRKKKTKTRKKRGKGPKTKLKSGKEEKEKVTESTEPSVDAGVVEMDSNRPSGADYLEQALDDALLVKNQSNESSPLPDNLAAKNDNAGPSPEKRRRSKLRLVLRPLSVEEKCCSEHFTLPECLGISCSNPDTISDNVVQSSNQHSPVCDTDIPSQDSSCVASNACRQNYYSNTSLSNQMCQPHLHEHVVQSHQVVFSGISEALDCVLSDGQKGNCVKGHQPAKSKQPENHEEVRHDPTLLDEVQDQASSEPITHSKSRPRIVIRTTDDPLSQPTTRKPQPKRVDPSEETSVFHHLGDSTGISNVILSETMKPGGRVDIAEYPSSYRSLAFLPYNPLPVQLEEVVFPDRSHPLASFDDPYWPSKGECLDLVSALRVTGVVSGFTGTFLNPEARGANVQKLFASLPHKLPSYMRQKPRCTDIVELPYSMAAMDHLEPIMYRTTLRTNKQLGERGLRKVLASAVTGGSDVAITFEESGERVYAAMLKNGPNWILFNIASLYWRVVGDPASAVECLRRAVHFAPSSTRDVGYIGLANVLHKQGFLNEAVVVARTALDISGVSPVGHYVLASIYLSLRDHVASSLHLRAALHIQPVFDHALSALKLIRCSLKFKEERVFLKRQLEEKQEEVKKRHEAQLLKDIQEAMKDGVPVRTEHPAMVLENTDPPEIPEMKVEAALPSTFTGQDAIRYLTKLALIQRRDRREKKQAEMKKKMEDEESTQNTKDKAHDNQRSSPNTTDDETPTSAEKGSSSEPASLDAQYHSSPLTSSGCQNETEGENGVTPTPTTDTQTPQTQEIHSSATSVHGTNIPLTIDERNRDRSAQENDATLSQFPLEGGAGSGAGGGADSNKEPESDSETKREKEAMKTTQKEGANSERTNTQTNQKQARSQRPDISSIKFGTDNDIDLNPELERLIAETAKTINDQKTPVQRRVPAKIKSRDDIREEETRKRFPGIRPWPTLEDCQKSPLPRYVVFTSTWLSVTAKGVNVKEHVDFVSPLAHYPLLPYCNNDFGNSPKTLDHLRGMNGPLLTPYKAEKGLQEVLRNLDGTPRSLEEIATRIKLAMDKNTTSWVLSNLAALYWRIVGQGQLAVKCLRHSLYYSDNTNKDVALVSLANVLYRSGYDKDAAACIQMSLEVGGFENSPTLVVSHFTMANIFAAQGYLLEASGFYESTLQFQPEFQPAADRLRIVRCLMLQRKEKQDLEKKKK